MEWNKLLSPVRIRDFFVEPNPKSGSQELRTEFERDYDRAIFCTPVRRLHDKAQVFPLEPNDSVRTRLTHSLEVSTVARDMARAIGSWLEGKDEKFNEKQEKAIETIAATCGLIHDLRNPPFGHSGEMAIADWFKGKGDGFWDFDEQLKNDFLEFQGNAQTLRLISKLQVLSDPYGLNFTCGTMSTACKYTARSDEIICDSKIHEESKAGFFASEELIVELVRNKTGTGISRNPISFIVEAADDIVYSAVDLEDGIKKGVVDWATLKKELKKEFVKLASQGNSDLLDTCLSKASKIIGKKGSIRLTGSAKDEALSQAFRVVAIGESVKAVISTFKKNYSKIMKGDYHNELFKDSDAFPLIKACKKVGVKYIYNAKQNLELEVMGRKIIHDLMDLFWEGVSQNNPPNFASKIYKLISRNYQAVYEGTQKKPLDKHKGLYKNYRGIIQLPKKYKQMQLVTDYICGMTDNFARTLHQKLTDG